MAFGLLPTGFSRKRLADIVSDLEAAIKAAFGLKIRLDSKSLFGKLIGTFAQPAADVWELCESVYNAFYPSTSEGTSLDNVAELLGVTRSPATTSAVTEVLEGVVGTTIGIGSIVRTATVLDQFETLAAITLAVGVCVRSTTSVLTLATGNYTITINGVPFTYGATVPADVAGTISAALEIAINAGAEPVTALDLGAGIVQVDGDADAAGLPTPFTLVVTANLAIDKIANLQAMESVVSDAIPGFALTLTDIVTPISGWTAAWNPLDAVLGTLEETDAALRLRRAQSVATAGAGTVEAVRAAMLAVSGVTAAFVLQNTSDVTDGDGLPPHSMEVVLLGGDADVIAAAEWASWGGGIESHGDVTVIIIDSQGFSQSMRHSRPTPVDMWVRATYTTDPEAVPGFPTNGEALMEAALLAAGVALTVGEDVLPAHFFAPVIAACTGLRTLVIEVVDVAGHPGGYISTPWAIGALEISAFIAGRCVATV